MNSPAQYESDDWNTASGIMRPGGLRLTHRLLELSGLEAGARVLDVGCGRAVSVEWLREQGYDAHGVDHSDALISEGLARCPALTLHVADAGALPFPDGAFDAVLLECVLSVMPTGQALTECARVLVPEGLLLISDVYGPAMTEGTLSAAWWAACLEAAGMRCEVFEDHTRELRSFAAQLLWDTGSLDGLRHCMGCAIPKPSGYFAMRASKGGIRA